MSVRPLLLSPLLLIGCAAHHWVNPAVTDPLQVDIDTYACMKENAYVADSLVADRGGVRARQDTKVDDALFRACMRARGYTWEEVPEEPKAPQTPYFSRASRSDLLVIGVETGLVGGWSAERTVHADLSALLSDPDAAPVLDSSSGLAAKLDVSLGGSVALRVSPSVDVGLRGGVRSVSSSTEGRGSASEAERVLVEGSTWVYQSNFGAAWDAAAIVRVRPTLAPRIFVGGEVGATPTLAFESFDVDATVIVDDDTTIDTTYEIPSEPWTLVPYLRAGLGMDIIHPDPVGLTAACHAEIALRPGAIQGTPEVADQVGAGCVLTLAVGFAKGAG